MTTYGIRLQQAAVFVPGSGVRRLLYLLLPDPAPSCLLQLSRSPFLRLLCSALKSSHIRHGSIYLAHHCTGTYVRTCGTHAYADGGAAAAFHGQKTDAASLVGRALSCFNDRYVSVHMCIYTRRLAYRSFGLSLRHCVPYDARIYSGCQGALRLGPEGALDVPPGSVDAFCGGPCLAETHLVLRCVDDGIVAGFRFYNGASAADVRLALARGCGRSGLRGDFDVLQRLGGDGHLYGRGSDARVSSLAQAMALLLSAAAAVVLVWA